MPSNPLLERLALLYSQENTRYPHLKAVTLAQWMLESGRGSSELAQKHYNFGGLKYRNELALHATKVSYNAHDGKDWYCKFPTIESFINGYWAFINRSPYSGWEEHATDAETFINFIGPIYTPTPGYAKKVMQLVPEATALLESVNGGNGNNGTSTAQPVTSSTTTTSTLPTLGTIVLDPGHGGEAKLGGSSANNAISFSGVKEKKLTLDFCLILQQELAKAAAAKNKQIKVVLTRTSDKNVGIRDRAKVAAQNKANLFLCLHFNGLEDEKVRGVETFFRAKSNGNPNLADDIDFATAVQKSLFNSLKSIDNKARDRGVKPDTDSPIGNLGVMDDGSLGNTNRPDKCRSCYVELEFISNPDVDKLLISGPKALQNRQLVMGNLAKTMVDYLEKMNGS